MPTGAAPRAVPLATPRAASALPPVPKAKPAAKPVAAAVAAALPEVDIRVDAKRTGKAAASPDRAKVAARPRKKKQTEWLILGGAVVVLLIALVAAGSYALSPTAAAIFVGEIGDQGATEHKPFEVRIPAQVSGLDATQVRFALTGAPDGLAIDPQTGVITWTPAEQHGGEAFPVTLTVSSPAAPAAAVERKFRIVVKEAQSPPTITPVSDLNADEGSRVSFTITASDPDRPPRKLRYQLIEGQKFGAKVDTQTGEFEWQADGEPGKIYQFTVRAQETVKGGLSADMSFNIRINGSGDPVERLASRLRARKLDVTVGPDAKEPHFGRTVHVLKVSGEILWVADFPTTKEADEAAQQIPPDASQLFGKPQKWSGSAQIFRGDKFIALYTGANGKLLDALNAECGQSIAAVVPPRVEATPTPDLPTQPLPPLAAAKPSGDAETLATMYKENKLFLRKFYPEVRKLFSDRFIRDHAGDIKSGFGADHDALMKWLDEHVEIKEELFTALDPATDDLTAALALFHDLWKQFPAKIAGYGDLAIATAVVWDKDNEGISNLENCVRAAKAKMPDGRLLAIDNFKYLVEAEPIMEGRIQFVPWEFLVHVVNDKTPRPDREWAVSNYLDRRVMFGKCYHDVPYDYDMLNSNFARCHLEGKLYTLPNIRQFGGVCMMQADFAARVGKSLGVPSEYVRGQGRFGGIGHAWVMWVELLQVTASNTTFSLQSHGRYFQDQYYIGELNDPQSGEPITDRQLELRLQTVGMDRQAKRHAELSMLAYPELRDRSGAKMELYDQVHFHEQVIALSPGNEAAWKGLAKIARDLKGERRYSKQMKVLMDKLFTNFARFPDFTWEVFDDLAAYYDSDKQRNALYEQLVQLYESSGRPDLACEARLVLADGQVAAGRPMDAIDGLAFTIRKFPQEGRYVPKILDKMEKLCAGTKDADAKLVQFYAEFLPAIPQMRGNDPSDYCMDMFKRGIALFTRCGETQLAQSCQAQLELIQAGKGRKG
jgi:hypothetical protein